MCQLIGNQKVFRAIGNWTKVRSGKSLQAAEEGAVTMHTEHAQVVLKKFLPHIGLEPGDVGVVVQVHNEGEAYEVEFLTMSGVTIGVETIAASDLRAASGSAIVHERELIAS